MLQMSERLVWEDDFKGPELSQYWVGGHFNRSLEVHVEIRDGLRINLDEGVQYASAGVVTKDAINGDFEAELMFDVTHPAQGSTFELAAILVAPPPETFNPSLAISEAHRVFNVHGAPPYVSSEFDESDGWRIGWNWGDKQGAWDKTKEWRADNTDNEYGPSKFGPGKGPTQGWLRLSRKSGTLWQASGRRLATDTWFESGRQSTELLTGPVYLRIVAKHWVKHRLNLTVAPENAVVLTSFKLRAFSGD